MKTRGWFPLLGITIVTTAAAGFGGCWYGSRTTTTGARSTGDALEASHDPGNPVVPVVTVPIRLAVIADTVSAYGTVVAEAGDVRAVSVPFESRVLRVLVTPGQQIAIDTPVIQLEASPDAQLALQEATSAVEAAARDLKETEQRFADHLATNIDLFQAQRAARITDLKLESLIRRGVGQQHEVKARFDGIVSKVSVQDGQIVAAGGPLVELAATSRVEVRLNVDPSAAAMIKPGQSVRIRPLEGTLDDPIEGQVRFVSRRVDPVTRMVDLRVSLPPGARLMLDQFVTGEIVRKSARAMVVPRSAALPNEDGTYTIFTVKWKHAAAHIIRVGLRDKADVQVIGDGLNEGDAVIASGNYLVKDGMEVDVAPHPVDRTPSPEARP